ncbi:MAG: hypothetical protein AB8B74_02525 [Crocinitomicaceae bacterium]
MLSIKPIILLFSCILSHFIFSQNTLFVGTYTNALIGLTISINKDYTGNYTVLDQNYPVKAVLVDESQLRGTYVYNSQEVVFDILLDNNKYSIKTEGIKLRLIYQSNTQNQSPDVSTYKQTIKTPSSNEKLNISLSSNVQSFPAAGYQFKGLRSWNYQLLENYIHYFQSEDLTSSMIILPHDYTDRNQVKLVAQTEGIQEDDMVLLASEQIIDFGSNGILGAFSGWIDGVNSKAAIISLFSPHGGGVTIMVYTKQSRFNSSYMEAVKKIANSVKFTKPVESELVKQWRKKLSSKKLVYYNTGDNSTEKITYTLYANSQFSFYNSSSYASSDTYNDYSSASTNDDSGNWKIKEDNTGVFIEFKYMNGTSSSQYLKKKENSYSQIFLDGMRYFITEIED